MSAVVLRSGRALGPGCGSTLGARAGDTSLKQHPKAIVEQSALGLARREAKAPSNATAWRAESVRQLGAIRIEGAHGRCLQPADDRDRQNGGDAGHPDRDHEAFDGTSVELPGLVPEKRLLLHREEPQRREG